MQGLIYTLINKETPLCDFIIEGEGELELCKIVKEYNPLPFWCNPLSTWVDNRSSAKHRSHVNKILEMCGGKTKSGFIALTHCLSLTDTLWVKSEKENVTWKQLNLYENNFDEVISKLSFDAKAAECGELNNFLSCKRREAAYGNGLFGIQMSTTSPELTTDMAFVPFAEEGFDFGKDKDGKELDFDEYLSKRGPVIGSDYVAPARAILTPEIKKCVEEIRETPLTVPCDEKFTEHRLDLMNMIKNVQCERILGFDAKWEF
ncbi:MAG: hypothetical protein K6B17_09870 [Treponema sp.]|nr:hypothetical protein [Treponema sp.]